MALGDLLPVARALPEEEAETFREPVLLREALALPEEDKERRALALLETLPVREMEALRVAEPLLLQLVEPEAELHDEAEALREARLLLLGSREVEPEAEEPTEAVTEELSEPEPEEAAEAEVDREALGVELKQAVEEGVQLPSSPLLALALELTEPPPPPPAAPPLALAAPELQAETLPEVRGDLERLGSLDSLPLAEELPCREALTVPHLLTRGEPDTEADTLGEEEEDREAGAVPVAEELPLVDTEGRALRDTLGEVLPLADTDMEEEVVEVPAELTEAVRVAALAVAEALSVASFPVLLTVPEMDTRLLGEEEREEEAAPDREELPEELPAPVQDTRGLMLWL